MLSEPGRGESSVATYESRDLNFCYPARWRRIEGVEFPLAEATGEEQVGDTVFGIDRDNWVSVVRVSQRLDEPVSEGNVGQLVAYLERYWPKLADALPGGGVVASPRRFSRAGLSGYELVVRFESTGRVPVEQRIVGLFEGRTSYVLSCQHRPGAGERVAREIESGCSQAVASFRPGLVG